MYFIAKVMVTALVVAGISELSKRFSLMAALLASLPMTTVLAFIWIYIESKDTAKISTMSYDIFWLVLPSLAFFLILPMTMKLGIQFPAALALSSVAMAIIYIASLYLLKAVR